MKNASGIGSAIKCGMQPWEYLFSISPSSTGSGTWGREVSDGHVCNSGNPYLNKFISLVPF